MKVSADMILAVLVVDVGTNSVDNVKAMSGVVETPHNKCSSHSTNW